MDLKDYIKLKTELAEEPQLTEEDILLYNSILARVKETAAARTAFKKRFNIWKVIAPVSTAIVACIITLTCIFTLKGGKELTYNYDDIITIATTYEEMRRDIKYFDLSGLNSSNSEIYMTYESESGDKLFYNLDNKAIFYKLNLDIVININYNHDFKLADNVQEKSLTDYVITYSIVENRGDSETNYKGWLKVKTETVYFDYTQVSAAGDEVFFETLQQIIKVKK